MLNASDSTYDWVYVETVSVVQWEGLFQNQKKKKKRMAFDKVELFLDYASHVFICQNVHVRSRYSNRFDYASIIVTYSRGGIWVNPNLFLSRENTRLL